MQIRKIRIFLLNHSIGRRNSAQIGPPAERAHQRMTDGQFEHRADDMSKHAALPPTRGGHVTRTMEEMHYLRANPASKHCDVSIVAKFIRMRQQWGD
jgi:hypothetical protein